MTSVNNPVTVVVDTTPIVTAINQGNDEKSTFTVTTSQTAVPNTITAGNSGLLVAATPLMAEMTITNPSSNKVKIMLAAPVIGVAYNSVTDYLYELTQGGSMTIDSPTCKGAVYGIASNTGLNVNIAKTIETLAVA